MRATNHAITGAIIAVAIDKPLIALPLAFLSHFVQDAIPHFGYAGHGGYKEGMKHVSLKFVMVGDLIIFLPFIAVLLAHHVSFWVYAAAFLALCPDFYEFLGYFLFHIANNHSKFSRFASFIQWCERPWGLGVEVIWYIGGMLLLVDLLT